MAERFEINENELTDVVGGALVWESGVVYPQDDPDARYSFTSYSKCRDYIKANWPGGKQNEDTLIMLEEAGLVHRI